MTGTHPTVGFMVLMGDLPSSEANERVRRSLDALISQRPQQADASVPSYLSGMIGNTLLEVLIFSQDTENGIFVCIDFDEDEVVDLSRNTGLTVAELLSPYIAALETVNGTEGIGVGFELSPPSSIEDKALKDAGIALFFLRDRNTETWTRREIQPFVGHYIA